MPKTLCKISIFLIFISIVTYTCSHRTYDYSVPDFTLPDIYGRNVRLYRVLEDNSVMIVLWTLWSRFSIVELDAFLPYADELNAMNIKVLAISQDGQLSLPNVKPFAEDHEWPEAYIVLCDTARVMCDLYEIVALPTTIVIDQDGEIVFTLSGYEYGEASIVMDTLRVIFCD